MRDNLEWLRSSVSGVNWPAMPRGAGSNLLALLFQLERSQWLAPEELRDLQFRQLDVLLRHAYRTAPYYHERWMGAYDPAVPLTAEAFSGLPLLTRPDLQAHFETLCSREPLPTHGESRQARTSGSSGMPARVLKNGLTELMWQVFLLREHLWHGRDLNGKLVTIRQGVSLAEGDGWGPATDAIVAAGRAATMPVGTDVSEQLEWLVRQQPDYLLSHPTNLSDLARLSIKRGMPLPSLRQVRTRGEMLSQETRDLCREAWNVPVVDAYSANEVGYIALQCPEHEHYHVQAEGVLVEVLDDEGAPCQPGGIGRIVITMLHNFAMPLVRYEIGDYAEVGPSCSCGRGLPVLSRIMGRVRNVLILANGERFWPSFATHDVHQIAPVRQYQFVQKEYDRVEARLVTDGPLPGPQEEELRRHFLSRLPAGFRLNFVYYDEIPRGAGGKFEYFISEVAAPKS
jgi:phenylacetate-CoA ligase